MGYLEQGAGEALVLIHGLGANADSWAPQMEALARNYRVIAMDLRGRGQSGFRAEEPVTLRVFADDVAALITNLEIDQAHFCGISMGGMIALEILVRYGGKVKSLILVGEEDQATPEGYAGYLQKNIRGSVLQVISHAGHFANLENPAAFNWQVCAHLKRCQDAEGGPRAPGRTARPRI